MRIIAGSHKNKQIVTPKGLATRPTSGKLRGSLFNICQGYIKEARFLDLFAGSGAIGLEALSRGALSATFIDNSKEAIHCIKKNLAQMNFENSSTVLFGDVFSILEKLGKLEKRFDIIYADPPYREGFGLRVLKAVDNGELLMPSGDLFIEEEDLKSIHNDELKTLKHVSTRPMGRAMLHHYRRIN